MERDQKNSGQSDPRPLHESNMLPATEIVKNSNSRANENISGEEQNDKVNEGDPVTGTEITDGEDG